MSSSVADPDSPSNNLVGERLMFPSELQAQAAAAEEEKKADEDEEEVVEVEFSEVMQPTMFLDSKVADATSIYCGQKTDA